VVEEAAGDGVADVVEAVFRYYVLTNQSGPSGQICLTFSNAKVSVNLAIFHPPTINCHPVSCIYDGIRQILTLIIPKLGNICQRVANFRHKFVSCSKLL